MSLVHPSQLLRSHSDEGASQFSAPLDSINRDPIDCGLQAFPCLARWMNLEKLATPRIFLGLLVLAGLLQGCCLSYFRGTAWIWTQFFTFDKLVVEWLIYINEIFTGVAALVVGYYGNKIHRPSWLGGLLIFQSLSAVVLLVPEFYRPVSSTTDVNPENELCAPAQSTQKIFSNYQDNVVPLVTLFTFQLLFSFASISFVCHGLTYLDDSVKGIISPTYVAVAFSSRELGKHFGMYLAWIPHWYNSVVFITPVWLVLAALTTFIGIAIAMFSKNLPSVVLKQAVASLLDIAQGIERIQTDNATDESFCSSFYRLLKNRILLINIFALTFMYSAIINFEIFDSFYFQSKFLVPSSPDLSKFHETWLSQIIVSLLKQPFIAMCLVTSGVIISRLKPSARSLSLWNGSVLIAVIVLLIPHTIFGCDDTVQSDREEKLQFFCNYNCRCQNQDVFNPVCTEQGQMTYYSPCHAGCMSVETINDVKIYSNCTCGEKITAIVDTSATEGSCNSNKCFLFWSLSQVTLIICSGLLATTVIPSVMISLRSVLVCDKALALALEFTFVSIIPFVPFKIIYDVVAGSMCQYFYDDACKMHSPNFATFISVATMSLIGVSSVLTLVVFKLVEGMDMYRVGNKEKRLNGNHDDYDEDENIENASVEFNQDANSARAKDVGQVAQTDV